MTVAELIERLRECNPEYVIVAAGDDGTFTSEGVLAEQDDERRTVTIYATEE